MKETNFKKTLRASYLDGVFACIMTGLIADYFTPFALFLKASARHIGLLAALPNFFSSVAQFKSAELAAKVRSRRVFIVIFVSLQALMLLPMAWLALRGGSAACAFIGMAVLFSCFGAIVAPAWGSFMSDIVPKEKRGKYFGWRQKTLGLITLIFTFAAGAILHFSEKFSLSLGFFIIFVLAFIARVISVYYLGQMKEPPTHYKKEDDFTFIDFIKRLKHSNFAQFVMFVSLMSLSVNTASPFFSVLMLRDLKMDYLTYSVITVATTLTTLLVIERWGRHADLVGNLKIIRFTSYFIGLIPLLWLINQHPAFLFFAQVFAGFLWAGFNLCASNFIYDAVTPQKRARCIAYFNFINGMAVCAGALIGGFMVNRLPAFMGYRIFTLFLISAALRLIVGLIMPRMLKEVRPVEPVKSNQLFFSVVGLRPIIGLERRPIKFLGRF